MGLGFVPVGKYGYFPKEGDYVVVDGSFPHLDGHVAYFTGGQWVSDFGQGERMIDYKPVFYQTPITYTIYRYPSN